MAIVWNDLREQLALTYPLIPLPQSLGSEEPWGWMILASHSKFTLLWTRSPLCCSCGEAGCVLSWNQKLESWWKRHLTNPHTSATTCPLSPCRSWFQSHLLTRAPIYPTENSWPVHGQIMALHSTQYLRCLLSCLAYFLPRFPLECEFHEGRDCVFSPPLIPMPAYTQTHYINE